MTNPDAAYKKKSKLTSHHLVGANLQIEALQLAVSNILKERKPTN